MQTQNVYENYYLGEFLLMHDELSDHQLAIFTITTNSEEKATSHFAYLENRKKMRHENLIRLLDTKITDKSSWCANIFSIISTYEYLPNSLQTEINTRKQTGKFFNSLEILRISFDLIDVLSFLQANNTIHQNLSPTLIYLFEDLAMGMHRVKLFEALEMSKNKRSNLVSALASNLDLYYDPTYFNWYSKSSQAFNVQNQYKSINKNPCVQFRIMSVGNRSFKVCSSNL